MKTVMDVAAFLKRTGAVLSLSFDADTGRFLAWTKRGEGTSKYLDDALDNMVIELRRADSSQVAAPPQSTCPKCNSLPITYVYGNISRLQCSQCVEQWPAPIRKHVKFANVKSTFVFDGSNWSSVQP